MKFKYQPIKISIILIIIQMRSIILLLLCFSAFTFRRRSMKPFSSDHNTPPQKLQYFDQIVDHFNYLQSQFWKQRYWVIEDYFDPQNGPVFLFICGEFVCPGVPDGMQWVLELAIKFKGLVLVTEHRFYGESMPFGNDSLNLDKLTFLNSEQAISDLAYFISEMKAKNKYKITENTKWIAMSGSYPGALAAWLRYKYPHLVAGAIASSAVIEAIEDFKEFDEQIYLSTVKSGDYCPEAIKNANNKVEWILLNQTEGAKLKAEFEGGEKLTDDEFLFFWTDSIVGQVQFGMRTSFCESLKGKTSDEQFSILKKSAQQNNQVYEYGSYYLKNVSFQWSHNVGSRCWYYQSCTEFGFWQTPSNVHSLRSQRLNLEFYKKLCSDSFGEGIWPDVRRKNWEYGGLDQQNSNLFMSNGVEDPWRWASLQSSKKKIISRIADCTNCAHIGDLFTPSSTDPVQLKEIRNEELELIAKWLGD